MAHLEACPPSHYYRRLVSKWKDLTKNLENFSFHTSPQQVCHSPASKLETLDLLRSFELVDDCFPGDGINSPAESWLSSCSSHILLLKFFNFYNLFIIPSLFWCHKSISTIHAPHCWSYGKISRSRDILQIIDTFVRKWTSLHSFARFNL